MPKNAHEVIEGSEVDVMATVNQELVNAGMAIIERVLLFCEVKGVRPKDVAIVGPNFVDGKITFKIRYGKNDPGRGL